MEFTFQLNYDQKAMTAMTHALRTGLEGSRDKKSRIFGWGLAAATALILVFSGKLDRIQIFGWVVLALFICYLVWQDQVNAALALRKLPVKMRTGQWLFREDGYYSNSEAGECDYSYKNIFAMLECQGYLILVFYEGSAHIVDLSTIQGGKVEDFRRLLRRETSLTIQNV